jgi:IS30 family transposase
VGRHDKVQLDEVTRILELRGEGKTIAEVAAGVGRHSATVDRVLSATGGVPPRRTERNERVLSVVEREEISLGLERGETFTAIAARLGTQGRAPSTVSREVNNNGGRAHYRAWAGERRASQQAARPKTAKLAGNDELRAVVEGWLVKRWSPEQIALRLRSDYPDRPEMWVSHETIYQSLFVQTRGALRKDLTACLRSGRTRRTAHAASTEGRGRGRLVGMINIRERPAEVEDRAVPGHWEGDLILGKNNRSAIGTLVERTSRFVVLLHLPHGHGAQDVYDALIAQIQTLPEHLWRSLTWDQGKEMARHVEFSIATGIDVYFCDPHSPWQRGTNENTNGLLREYFPKGTDLSVYSQPALDAVARELNDRPRKTLNAMKPSEKLAEIIATAA